MIFDGEKKVYILSEKEYDEMFDGETHANLALIKANQEINRLKEQLEEANDLLKAYSTESLWESLSLSYDEARDYCKKWSVK